MELGNSVAVWPAIVFARHFSICYTERPSESFGPDMIAAAEYDVGIERSAAQIAVVSADTAFGEDKVRLRQDAEGFSN